MIKYLLLLLLIIIICYIGYIGNFNKENMNNINNNNITLNISLTFNELISGKDYISTMYNSIQNLLYNSDIIFDELHIMLDIFSNDIIINNEQYSYTKLNNNDIIKYYTIIDKFCKKCIKNKLTKKYKIYVLSYSYNNNYPSIIKNNYTLYKRLIIKYTGQNLLLMRNKLFKNSLVYLLGFLLCKTKYLYHFDGNRGINKKSSIKNMSHNSNFITKSIDIFNKYNNIGYICMTKEHFSSWNGHHKYKDISNSYIIYGSPSKELVSKYNFKGMFDNNTKFPHMSCQSFICDVNKVKKNLFPFIKNNKYVCKFHIESIYEFSFNKNILPIFLEDNIIYKIDS